MIRFAITLAASALMIHMARAEELACQGPFAKDADHERLIAAFGEANVAYEAIHGPERMEFKASVVYPKDPARRLVVSWWDVTARKRPARIMVEGSEWSGPHGLRIGTSLIKIEEMNGKPFSLYGFEWDYGGAIASWNGGRLNLLPGGCRLGIVFEADETVSEDVKDMVAGDTKFGSNSPVMRAAKPKVRSLSLGYPAK